MTLRIFFISECSAVTKKFTIFFSLLHVYRCCWNVKRTDKLLLQYISSMIMVSIFTAVYSSFRGREKNLCLQPLHGRDYTIDKCSKHSVYQMKIDFSVSKKITLSMKYPAGQTFDFFSTRKKKSVSTFFWLEVFF